MLIETPVTYFINDVLFHLLLLWLWQNSYGSKSEPPGTYFAVCSIFSSPHSPSWESERSSLIELFISALAFLTIEGSLLFSFLSFGGSLTCVYEDVNDGAAVFFSARNALISYFFVSFLHITHSPAVWKALAGHSLCNLGNEESSLSQDTCVGLLVSKLPCELIRMGCVCGDSHF